MTSTIPTTLTEYQQFVRTEALKVQVDMGWPDEKLNATLKALGLPEKLTFQVPVKITGTMTVLANVTDATSEEEARASVTTKTHDDLATLCSTAGVSAGHFGNLIGELTTVPTMDECKVGDPDLTLANTSVRIATERGNRTRCDTYNNSGYYCTRPLSHEGQHVAGGGVLVVAVWPVAA